MLCPARASSMRRRRYSGAYGGCVRGMGNLLFYFSPNTVNQSGSTPRVMKAMRAHQFGGPEQLRYEAAPVILPQAGQVQIGVRAAGINPADLVRLSGRLQPLTLPYIPGTDVCGEVEAVGSGVGHVKPGDRVFGRALTGGYAEKTCLAASEA